MIISNLLLIFVSFVFCQDSIDFKKIPKLDLRNHKVTIEADVNIDKIFEDRNAGFNVLSYEQIKEIKDKTKNFKPEKLLTNEIAIIETSLGTFKIELLNDVAPAHCENFKKLANSKFYDGTLFHRVIPGFIIQGGDILTRDGIKENDGTGNPGWILDAELSNLKHVKGTVSMHRVKSDINSAGSQFFITLSRQESLDSNYTVFGNVIENIEILDIINRVPSESRIAFKMLKESIPEEQKDENWSTFEYNDNQYYIKIPKDQNVENYKDVILERLSNNTRPSIPIRIISARVNVKESNLEE